MRERHARTWDWFRSKCTERQWTTGRDTSGRNRDADAVSHVPMKSRQQKLGCSGLQCHRRLRFERAGLEGIKRARQLTRPASPDR